MSSPMRVLMVSSDYLPAIGGVANHVHQLSRALVHKGLHVEVLQLLPAEVPPSRPLVDVADGVTVHRVQWKKSQHKLVDASARVVAAKRALPRLGTIDLVHQHDYRTSVMPARALAAASDSPSVFTNHTSDFLANSDSRLHRLLDRMAWRHADRVIAPSSQIAEVSKSVLRKPVVRIPNGVALDKYSMRTGEPSVEEFTVLCPRRMDPKNGVEYLAMALGMLPKPTSFARWRVVMTGDAEAPNIDKYYVHNVKQIASASPEWVKVEFAGNVPAAQMPALYAESHVVVMPSLVEAISLSALEAMASGVPVVASNVGGLGELFATGETGILVEAARPDAIAGALATLEANIGLRHQLAASARAEVEALYSWDSIAEMTLEVYKELVTR